MTETIHGKGCDAVDRSGRVTMPEACDCGADPFAQLTDDDMRAMRDAYEGTPRRRR